MGKSVKKEIWIADDGTEFVTKDEMLWHETKSIFQKYIDAYLDEVDMSDGGSLTSRGTTQKKSRARNEIEPFCMYLVDQKLVLCSAIEVEVEEEETSRAA